ncbi:MAG: aspartate--ammonia ligase [Clostridia bacterium]|nr:aspartate--ammonia ligase [Clostridia bacterium]
MKKTVIPKNYKSKLNIYRTQTAIGELKRIFESKLIENLNLKRVSAPLFVEQNSGLNDDLSGIENPVSFSANNTQIQIVHSLAKWKRLALYEYGFHMGEGIYTDMNAIRKDETTDNLHSIYVDQWDWERIISKQQRCVEYLCSVVKELVNAISESSEELNKRFPELDYHFSPKVTFITAIELYEKYPNLSAEERERVFVKEHGTTFIIGIGAKLPNGIAHSMRAPDYDDWSLNGDLIAYDSINDNAIELSSMGIRVDAKTLENQLELSGKTHRKELYFHKLLLQEKLPLTIGGGIGQSRLCMLLLQKAHVGEVQVSVWDEDTKNACKKAGVTLL